MSQHATNNHRATCHSCPHECALKPGQLGYCRARVATEDAVEPQSYGRITSLALDPIEKKPISRWMPGTTVLSLGGYGCNMRCPYCQNYSIAQVGEREVPWRAMLPDEVVDMALDLREQGCIGIAYTYNEPLTMWEFVRDTATLAHEAGLKNVLVSNGMASPNVLEQVAPLIDAANIDLKSLQAERYRRLGGDLATVQNTIATLAALDTCHLEVTTLAAPGYANTPEDIADITTWLANIDPNIPYHLSRFFPQYRMADATPTPHATMDELARVARRHMNDVILGNI